MRVPRLFASGGHCVEPDEAVEAGGGSAQHPANPEGEESSGSQVLSGNWVKIILLNRAEEPEPGVFGPLESGPLEKVPGAGAATTKIGSRSRQKYEAPIPAPRSTRKSYICYSSLGKIVSFYGNKTIILLVLYFLQFCTSSL